jgi:predicted nucleic acid-binding protein
LEPARRLVFLDASVLVAAARSPSGGSAVAIEVCGGTRHRAALSALILAEARSNIAAKFGEPELLRFYQQLAGMEPLMAPAPSAERLAQCAALATDKDAHVLAAALDCGASVLLTLDRRHLLTPRILGAGLPIELVTPGEFLQGLAGMGSGRA